jgi:hypothetical protein
MVPSLLHSAANGCAFNPELECRLVITDSATELPEFRAYPKKAPALKRFAGDPGNRGHLTLGQKSRGRDGGLYVLLSLHHVFSAPAVESECASRPSRGAACLMPLCALSVAKKTNGPPVYHHRAGRSFSIPVLSSESPSMDFMRSFWTSLRPSGRCRSSAGYPVRCTGLRRRVFDMLAPPRAVATVGAS